MTYNEWHKVFETKVKGYDAQQCEHALRDCHETLALHKANSGGQPYESPYYRKLWAEIDAIRERQLDLSRVPA